MKTRVWRADEPEDPWQGEFFVLSCGPAWNSFQALAFACQWAHLNKRQAEAVRLRESGADWPEIATALGVKERRVRELHQRATGQLSRREDRADLRECFRNVRPYRQGG